MDRRSLWEFLASSAINITSPCIVLEDLNFVRYLSEVSNAVVAFTRDMEMFYDTPVQADLTDLKHINSSFTWTKL